MQQRVTIHFQRIKFIVSHAVRFGVLATVQPAMGFTVKPAQLILHTLKRGLHFVEGHIAVVDLLLNAPANGRTLTRQVQQIFEQFSGYLDGVQPRSLALNLRSGRYRLRLIGRGHRLGLTAAAFDLADTLNQRLR